MPEQSYEKHARFVAGYHFVLSTLLLVCLVGAGAYLYRAIGYGKGRIAAATLLLLVVACLQLFWYCRIFALKAQDRAIRAEENLRHYVLTGSLLDPRLDVRQVIALRFASDGELAELASRAAEEGMAPDAVKRAVKSWRADSYRV